MGPRSTRSRSAVQVRIAVITEVSIAFGGLCNMCVCVWPGASVPFFASASSLGFGNRQACTQHKKRQKKSQGLWGP